MGLFHGFSEKVPPRPTEGEPCGIQRKAGNPKAKGSCSIPPHPCREAQPSTRLASLTGTAASWHVLEEPSLRGREKKITTNVPPIMSHEAELLFLPCWILPFPWYFPSPAGSRGDARTGQGSAGSRGTDRLSPGQGTTWASNRNPKQQVLLSSAPQAERNLRRRRWSALCAECGTA